MIGALVALALSTALAPVTVWICHAKEDLGAHGSPRFVALPWTDTIPWRRLGHKLTLYQTSDEATPLLLTGDQAVELVPLGTVFAWSDSISGEDLAVEIRDRFLGWQDFAVWLGDAMNASSAPGWLDQFEAWYEEATNTIRVRRPWGLRWCAEDVQNPAAGWYLIGFNSRWPPSLCGNENTFAPPVVIDGGTVLNQ